MPQLGVTMEKEAIIFYGMDLASEQDRTAYMMFDGERFKEISENEYNSLRGSSETTGQERDTIQVS